MSDFNIIHYNSQLTEKDKVKSYLTDFYIVDVGFIKTISSDKKTVDVIHAIKPQVYDFLQQQFVVKDQTITSKVEVIYFGSANFRQEFQLNTGDIGLLLGTRSYIEKARDVTTADKSKMVANYQQENLKFLPIGSNQTPVTLLQFLSDEIKLTSSIKNTTIDLKTSFQITTDADLDSTFDNNKIKTTSNSIEMTNRSGNNRIAIDSNLIDLKNSVSGMKAELNKLYSDLNNLNSYLQTLAGSTVPSGGGSLSQGATVIGDCTALAIQIATDKGNVANIFKT